MCVYAYVLLVKRCGWLYLRAGTLRSDRERFADTAAAVWPLFIHPLLLKRDWDRVGWGGAGFRGLPSWLTLQSHTAT